MKPICDLLEERVLAAMAAVGGAGAPAVVRPTQDGRFGDYQANGVMGLAKKNKSNPRQLAEQIVEQLDVADMCEQPEIAGPGFINFRLKPEWLAGRLLEAVRDPQRLGVDAAENSPVTVVDFSSPNIAKQMHVGHLRSTIIGDVIARVLDFWYGEPSKVVRQNHVGDWGLQMGMINVGAVIQALKNLSGEKNVQEYGSWEKLRGCIPLSEMVFNINELEWQYKEVNIEIKSDPWVENACREATLNLQKGEPEETEFWKKACEVSLNACHEIYEQLGVKLGLDDVCGESFYNDRLPGVIEDFAKEGLLEESEGAQCVFLEGFKSKEGEPLPLIVQKSDGAFLYATTDLAAIRYRVGELKAERVIYVTDSRQKLHFEMVFAAAKKAGWVDDSVHLEHVPFGSVLGKDNRPFKTRSGETVKLKGLLDEATKRARKIVEEKNPELSEELKDEISQAVGIGAVKYADLSNNLVSDYVFDWDKMLAMEGNTAPYMQYAYARVQSIFRKGQIDIDELLGRHEQLELNEPEELQLAKLLLRYGEIVEAVAGDLRPHIMTGYLFELAQAFSSFYTNCPVLKADEAVRDYRLLLCLQTARTIKHGLGLLGIEVIEQM
ncbi:MAG: arginine--tRNA ligase [Sedimentisphaerales bacterium]|nr:arginine--tRNA ligase [Sedimentisphaerales bacterium]